MTSRYTNAVLTVIAVCLVVLVLRPLTAPDEAHAQTTAPSSPRTAVLDVNIASIGGWELLERSALPVEIESQPVSIELRSPIHASCGCP
jgi:hypothetical protein